MGIFKKLSGFILSGGDKLTLPAADGASDQVLKTDGAGNLDWVAQGGSPPVFGTEYQYAESLGTTSNTGTTWVEKLKLTTASLPAGDYYIGWGYEWTNSSTVGDFKGQVELDDSTLLMDHQQEPQDSGADQKRPLSGFAVVTLTAGTHTVDIDFTSSVSGHLTKIYEVKLTIYRIS